MANDNTADNDTTARLDLLTEQLERVTAALVGFPSQVVALLSGQPAEAKESNGSSYTGKRRGRPPMSAEQKAQAAAERAAKKAPVPAKELSAMSRQILELVTAAPNKRMTQTQLAETLSVPRAQVKHHVLPLLERRALRAVLDKPVGKHEQMIYMAPDRLVVRGE